MSEKMEKIGNPISEEELESDEMVKHIHKNVSEMYDMNNRNLIATPEEIDKEMMDKVLGESKDGWHSYDLKQEEETVEDEKH